MKVKEEVEKWLEADFIKAVDYSDWFNPSLMKRE
jgi:hypothetical protein